MSRSLRLPLAFVLLAVAAATVLAVFLFTEEAQAPPSATTEGESQAQANAQQEAATLTSSEAPAATPTAVANSFQDRLVTDDAVGATALAFLPDGSLLVTDRAGRVRLHKPGASGTTLALDISASVCDNSERGLLGIAVDPNFESNRFVYLYYTYKKFGACPMKQADQNNPVNRVARFVMNANGDTIVPDNKPSGPGQVLINNIPSPNGNHNGGDLHFGKDDKLYVSVGDGACDYAEPTQCQPSNDASRDRNVLLGKILRINTDGSIPADNPYANSPNGVRCGELTNGNAAGGSVAGPGAICKETYASGFRNPFRFAIDPDAANTSLRANDVGGGRIEEVDQVRSGGDYGWNCREGSLVLNTSPPCPGNDMIGPINQYSHNTGCSSVTGGAFVPNNAGWPRSYDDAYLFADYVCHKIFLIQPTSTGGFARTTFANDLALGGPVSLAFGPTDGALYYTTFAGGGQVRRIVFTNNKSPIAELKATPTDPDTGKTFGPAPLTVNFNGSANDPEGDPVTFEWDFDLTRDANGNEQFTVDANGADINHIYQNAGVYTAALRVKDDRGNSDVVKRTIYAGNTAPPQPVIEFPAVGDTFTVGEEISLSGSAKDEGPDADPSPTLKWEVIRHHTAPNTHTHPYYTTTGPNGAFTAPAPEDLYSLNPESNYVEVRLTATDSQGLSNTVSRDIRPKTAEVRLGTQPPGFYLSINGSRIRAPRTLLAWEGSNLNLYAPPQSRDGRQFVFRSWSDGRGNRHTVAVTAAPKTYIATFRQR